MKGFVGWMALGGIIAVALLAVYLMGWRLVYDPATGITVAQNPENAFSWLSVWVQQLLGV